MCSKLVFISMLAALVAAVSADGKASSYANIKLHSGGHGYGGYNGYNDGGHYAPQKYAFKYGVNDHHTGDIKSQSEHGDGGNVHGSYSLKQPDGTTRVVNYKADPHNGFNAEVKIIGHGYHPQSYGHGKY